MTKERKLYLDIWCYELPYQSLTEKDCKKANDNNISYQRNMLEECDYLIGTWHALNSFMLNYMGLEIVADYLRPAIVTVKENGGK